MSTLCVEVGASSSEVRQKNNIDVIQTIAPSILRSDSALITEGHVTSADLNKSDQSIIAELFDFWRLDSSLCLFELLYLDVYHRLNELTGVLKEGESQSCLNNTLKRWSGLFLPAYAGFSFNVKHTIVPNTPNDKYSLSPARFVTLGIDEVRTDLNSMRDCEESYFASKCSKGGPRMRHLLEEKKQNMNKLLAALFLRLDLFEKLLKHPQSANFLSADNLFVTYQGSSKLDECDEKTLVHAAEYFQLLQDSVFTQDALARCFLGCSATLDARTLEFFKKMAEAYKTKTICPKDVVDFSLLLQNEITAIAYNVEVAERALQQLASDPSFTHRQFCAQCHIPIAKEKNAEEFKAYLLAMKWQASILLYVVYDLQRIFDFVMAEQNSEYLTNDKLFYQLFNLTGMLETQSNFYSDMSRDAADFFTINSFAVSESEMQVLLGHFKNLVNIYSKYKTKLDGTCDASYRQITFARQNALEAGSSIVFRLRNWSTVLSELDNFWLATQQSQDNFCSGLAVELEQFAEKLKAEKVEQQPLVKALIQLSSSLLASPIIFSFATFRIVHEILSQEKSLKTGYSDSDFTPERLQRAVSLAVLGESELNFAEQEPVAEIPPQVLSGGCSAFVSVPAMFPLANFQGKKKHKGKGPQSILQTTMQEQSRTLRNTHKFMDLLIKMGFHREPTLKKDGYARFSFKNGESILIPQKRTGEIPLDVLKDLLKKVQRLTQDKTPAS